MTTLREFDSLEQVSGEQSIGREAERSSGQNGETSLSFFYKARERQAREVRSMRSYHMVQGFLDRLWW